MLRRLFLCSTILGSILASTPASAAVPIYYLNKDNQTYHFKAVCNGKKAKIKFLARRRAKAILYGRAPCQIKTPLGKVEVNEDDYVEIRKGKLTVMAIATK